MSFDLSHYVNFDFDPDVSQDALDVNLNISADETFTEMNSGIIYGGLDEPIESGFAGTGSLFEESTTLSIAYDAFVSGSAMKSPMHLQSSTDLSLHALSSRLPGQSEPVGLARESQQEVSRWLPVSPHLQKHLNMVYASQLKRLAADPNPPPALFLPAEEERSAMTMPCVQSPFNGDDPGPISSQVPDTQFDIASIDPSLLMQGKDEMSVFGTDQSNLSVTDSEGSEATKSGEKRNRTLDAEISDCEPAPKRHKTSEANEQPITVTRSNESDEQSSPPFVNKVHESLNETSNGSVFSTDDIPHNSAPSNLSSDQHPPFLVLTTINSNHTPKNGFKWRFEQKDKARFRKERATLWERRRRRRNRLGINGKYRAPKGSRLLDEIRDTREFAEAQGQEAEGRGYRRGVRKVGRRGYVG